MKKYSKREKNLIRAVVAVLLLVGVIEVWEYYVGLKEDLQSEIVSLQSELTTYTNNLKKETLTVVDYEEKIAAVDEEIARSRDRIMELPSESSASLLVRQHISEVGQHVDMNINAINNRKADEVNEETGLLEMKTYFTYDSELEPLLNFFQIVDQQGYYMVIDQLTLSARRTFRRRRKGRTTVNRPERNPLSGNMILSTLYLPKADGNSDNYNLVLTGQKRPPRPAEDIDADTEEPLDEEPLPLDDEEAEAPDESETRAMNVRHNRSAQTQKSEESEAAGDDLRGPAQTRKPELQKRPRRLTGTQKGL